MPSVWRIRSADNPTPQRDSVATSGETTLTRPRKYASKRQTYERPKKMPAGANRRNSRPLGGRRAQNAAAIVPATSVVAAAVPAVECVRSEEHGGGRGVDEAELPDVARPVPLGREQRAARDDRDRAQHERQAERLVKEHEGDRHCDQGGAAHHHGRPRCARLTDREGEEDLRAAGSEQAGEQEGPGAVQIRVERRSDERNSKRGDDRREGRTGCVAVETA
jgi:hypothetical protein